MLSTNGLQPVCILLSKRVCCICCGLYSIGNAFVCCAYPGFVKNLASSYAAVQLPSLLPATIVKTAVRPAFEPKSVASDRLVTISTHLEEHVLPEPYTSQWFVGLCL